MSNSNIVIGKFTLESLTNGMYATSKDLFREYVQNAVDSIDNAIKDDVVFEKEAYIKIIVDSIGKKIRIEDNGQGIQKEYAAKFLLDIGNSSKSRKNSRGFRGIGRLAGMGYCNKLVFKTSYFGEQTKSIITFDADLLRELLRSSNDKNESITDVLDAVTKIDFENEKENKHYFIVELDGVDSSDGLLECERIKTYLIQNLPLKFSELFKWGDVITKKIAKEGYKIPSYSILFEDRNEVKELNKRYRDIFISDRVKKYKKTINDIEIKPFYDDDNNLLAILWYVKTDYSGTILDEHIKGIRVRQGNILIGNKSTSNQYFKEERFNGWLFGELYVTDIRLVPNARRDDFENTAEYIKLKDMLYDWSNTISKEIRKISLERSVNEDKKMFVEANNDDENNLIIEDLSFISDDEEINDDVDESSIVANNELFDKFKMLLRQKSGTSKYLALNMRNDISMEQKRILEKVFDIIFTTNSHKKAESIVNDIVENY